MSILRVDTITCPFPSRILDGIVIISTIIKVTKNGKKTRYEQQAEKSRVTYLELTTRNYRNTEITSIHMWHHSIDRTSVTHLGRQELGVRARLGLIKGVYHLRRGWVSHLGWQVCA